MHELKIVCDVNVLISGLLWEGIPHKIIKLVEKEGVSLFVTASILAEVNEVLRRDKFKERIERINASVIELMESLLSIIVIIQEPNVQSVIKDDPDDDNILACALACKADVVISGDSHLLELKEYKNMPILTPKEFWHSYVQKSDEC